jgi:hypothetical protein
MNEVIEKAEAMLRTIRPAEAVKAYKVIEGATVKIIAEKAKAWTGWTHVIGPFIQERTEKAKREAKGTRGPTYSAVVKKGMGQFYETYQKLSDNGTVSYLIKIMENLDAVDAWRYRIPEDERPTSPKRVWLAYEGSLLSTPEYKGDKEAKADTPDPEEDEEDDGDVKGDPRIKRKKPPVNRDEEAARYIEELEEKVGKSRMTSDPEINATNIWFGLKDAVGYEAAIQIARVTIDKLVALLDRIEAAGK